MSEHGHNHKHRPTPAPQVTPTPRASGGGGFSLMELMIVMIVIGTLFMLGIGAYMRAVSAAEDAVARDKAAHSQQQDLTTAPTR